MTEVYTSIIRNINHTFHLTFKSYFTYTLFFSQKKEKIRLFIHGTFSV